MDPIPGSFELYGTLLLLILWYSETSVYVCVCTDAHPPSPSPIIDYRRIRHHTGTRQPTLPSLSLSLSVTYSSIRSGSAFFPALSSSTIAVFFPFIWFLSLSFHLHSNLLIPSQFVVVTANGVTGQIQFGNRTQRKQRLFLSLDFDKVKPIACSLHSRKPWTLDILIHSTLPLLARLPFSLFLTLSLKLLCRPEVTGLYAAGNESLEALVVDSVNATNVSTIKLVWVGITDLNSVKMVSPTQVLVRNAAGVFILRLDPITDIPSDTNRKYYGNSSDSIVLFHSLDDNTTSDWYVTITSVTTNITISQVICITVSTPTNIDSRYVLIHLADYFLKSLPSISSTVHRIGPLPVCLFLFGDIAVSGGCFNADFLIQFHLSDSRKHRDSILPSRSPKVINGTTLLCAHYFIVQYAHSQFVSSIVKSHGLTKHRLLNTGHLVLLLCFLSSRYRISVYWIIRFHIKWASFGHSG